MCGVQGKNARLRAEYNYEGDILRTAFLGSYNAEACQSGQGFRIINSVKKTVAHTV